MVAIYCNNDPCLHNKVDRIIYNNNIIIIMLCCLCLYIQSEIIHSFINVNDLRLVHPTLPVLLSIATTSRGSVS